MNKKSGFRKKKYRTAFKSFTSMEPHTLRPTVVGGRVASAERASVRGTGSGTGGEDVPSCGLDPWIDKAWRSSGPEEVWGKAAAAWGGNLCAENQKPRTGERRK